MHSRFANAAALFKMRRMGRPKTISDEKLLDAALKVFRERGYAAASTREIARVAKISQAILYQRFKTKDALFFAAISRHSSPLTELAAIDATKHTPRTYLAEFGAKAKEHYRKVLPTILTLAAHPEQGYGEQLMREIHKHNRAGEMSAMLVVRLREWQERGEIGPVPVVAFAHLFLHVIHTRAFIEVMAGKDKHPALPVDMQEFVDVFWQGLRPDGAKPAPGGKKG